MGLVLQGSRPRFVSPGASNGAVTFTTNQTITLTGGVTYGVGVYPSY